MWIRISLKETSRNLGPIKFIDHSVFIRLYHCIVLGAAFISSALYVEFVRAAVNGNNLFGLSVKSIEIMANTIGRNNRSLDRRAKTPHIGHSAPTCTSRLWSITRRNFFHHSASHSRAAGSRKCLGFDR